MAPPGDGFDRWRARAALIAGPLLFAAILLLPLPLPAPAHRLAAVMALVVVLWIGEPIPLAATALLGPALALLVGAFPEGLGKGAAGAVFSKFGDPILMLFVGGFFIAEAMQVHGLDRRIALSILSTRLFSCSSVRLVSGLAVCSFLLSMWISNTATTALMLPIAAGMLAVARGGGAPGKVDAAAALAIAYAATLGGLATPVGTAPNLIGIAQIRSLAGVEIGFLDWMGIGLPVGAAALVALLLLLPRGIGNGRHDGLAGAADAEREKLGRWSRGEKVTALAFGVAVSLWIATGIAQIWREAPVHAWMESHLSEGAIAILASSLLFLVPAAPGRPTLTWKEAARIDWGTLLLLGGGLSLGELMLKTGLADAIGRGTVERLGVSSALGITAMAAGLAILLSEITSNTATATMLIPIVVGIAKSAGIDPVGPALAATLACSFGCALPVSTPPNALAYGTGWVPIPFMVRKGLLLDLCGFAIVVAAVLLLRG